MHNNKTIICRNILQESKNCPHGNKCVFAHNLEEQYINYNRKLAYDIINGKQLIPSNFKIDDELYRTFLQMTRVCKQCNIGKCSGGYNCKYGVINEKFQICYDDLVNNKCQNVDCKKNHLTNKGIKKLIQKINDDSDTETEDEIQKIIAYLNDDNVPDNYDESIFSGPIDNNYNGSIFADSNSLDITSEVRNSDNI